VSAVTSADAPLAEALATGVGVGDAGNANWGTTEVEMRTGNCRFTPGYEGEIFFTAGTETRTVGIGESVLVPPGTAHPYRNAGVPARMMAVYTSASMEGWFREVCTPVTGRTASPPPATPELIARLRAAGPRHDVEWS
jgi:Cupin domain